MSKNISNLGELTGGIVENLEDLTEDRIDRMLDTKIVPGNLAPLFYKNGQPILRADGTQLSLSYTHATVFAAHISKALNREIAERLNEVQDLPVPFWRPAHAFLVSADGYAILAMRSNATRNAIGDCINTAAGFPKIIGDRGETIEENLSRELQEETGLSLKVIADRKPINLHMRSDSDLLDKYAIKTEDGSTLPGIVPVIPQAYGLHSHLSVEDLMKQVHANHESVGFVAIKMNDLKKISDDAAIDVEAKFYSSALLETYTGQQQEISEIQSLQDLRSILKDHVTPRPQAGNYELAGETIISVTKNDLSEDFFSRLEMLLNAAPHFGIYLTAANSQAPIAETLKLNKA